MKTCVICSGPLTGQQRVTCSPKCRRKRNNTSPAYKKARAKYLAGKGALTAIKGHECQWCGEAFESAHRGAKFCSWSCRDLDRYGSSRPVYFPECLGCGCTFTSREPGRDVCSPKCRLLLDAVTRPAKVREEWRTGRECPGCGCMFSPLYTPNMVTCSKRCGRRVHRWKRKAREAEAIGSFTWSAFMRIAQRFDFCCAYCGDRPGALDPDHVVPLSRGGINSTANLLPACRMCNGQKRNLLLAEWAEERAAKNLPPRVTSWAPEDRRFHHLTQAILTHPEAA